MTADEEAATTTRRLVVFRHAKAAWPDDVVDHDRPLAERGAADAPIAGRWLRAAEGRGGGARETQWQVDLVVCSTAKRARQTWQLAGKQFDPAPKVTYDERLYGASASEVLEVLREVPDTAMTLVVVGHNPALQELVLALAGSGDDESLQLARTKFATSAIAVLEVPSDWAHLEPGTATLTHVEIPRA